VPDLARLHLITDDRVLASPDFPGQARQALAAGAGALALHLRGPGTRARTLHDLAVDLRPAVLDTGTLLVINDRVDLAAVVGAGGVQLGTRSLAPSAVRALQRRGLLDAGLRVGASVHDVDEARAAAGADWLVVGTLFETPSHAGRAGAGTDVLAQVAAVHEVRGAPLVGIGGVSPAHVAAVLGAGAYGVAALRGVWRTSAGSPARAVRAYLEALEAATEEKV
jgi:thiamine-phosphate pyrophosphorylase